jgi:hypothetical protein
MESGHIDQDHTPNTYLRDLKMRKIAALFLSLLVGSTASIKALACYPDYQHAVVFSWNHPDMPLKNYASGNLGIIQRNWARSYLCVAYRYLADKPLSAGEQSSALQLWQKRIYEQGSYLFDEDYYPSLNYDDLRFKILKSKPKAEGLYAVSSMAETFEITDSAYVFALTTLRQLIKQFGIGSSSVRDWTRAQDGVFAYNQKKEIVVPQPLSKAAPQKLKNLRLYQIAAAHLYQRQFQKAASEFKALAQTGDKTLADLCDYLAERAGVAYSLGAGAEISAAKALQRLEAKAAASANYQRRIEYLDLAGLVFGANLTPEENAERVLTAVLRLASANNVKPSPEAMPVLAVKESADAFGRNLGDLTYWLGLSDGPVTRDAIQRDDMTDWLATVYNGYDCFYDPRYQSDEEKRKYQEAHRQSSEKALLEWSKKRSLPWLVAVMLTSGLRGETKAQARLQAEALPPQSPAYLTARFYLIDALIAAGHLKEARAKLAELALTDNHKKATPTTTNLFSAQRLVCATSVAQYLDAATLKLAAASSNHLLVPDKWSKMTGLAAYQPPDMDALDVEVAGDIDSDLPYSSFLAWCKNSKAAPNLHGRIVCATWIRAILLQKDCDIKALTKEMARCYPGLAARLGDFEQARGVERDYRFAQICLDNFGFSPYVGAGLPRMGNSFDTFNYYQHNYWQTLPAVAPAKKSSDEVDDRYDSVADRANADLAPLLQGYYEGHRLAALIAPQQRAEAIKERRMMSKLIPARVLSGAVVAFAKTQPTPISEDDIAREDKEHSLSHYLYKAVKLPYWSGQSEQATKYSKQAYLVLHNRFAKSKWAKKLSFWY